MSTKAAIPPEEEELDKAHRGGLPLSGNLRSDSGHLAGVSLLVTEDERE